MSTSNFQKHFPDSATDVDIDITTLTSTGNESTSAVGPPATEAVIFLDPLSIRVPDTPNRLESSFENEKFEELRQGIAATGRNIQPIMVRWIVESAGVAAHWELVWGERRLRACREARVLVSAITAKTVASAMDDYLDRIRENHGRSDLSPWEFGQQVKYALEQPPGMRKSELALKIGCSLAMISRAHAMSVLPDVVVRAFESPNDLRYEDVKPLRDAYRRNAAAVEAESARINGEQDDPPPSKQTVRRLIQAAKGDFASCKPASEVGPTEFLESAGKRIGFWRRSTTETLEVHLEIAMSDSQRDRLLEQITTHVARKVLGSAAAASKKAPRQTVSGESSQA